MTSQTIYHKISVARPRNKQLTIVIIIIIIILRGAKAFKILKAFSRKGGRKNKVKSSVVRNSLFEQSLCAVVAHFRE